MRKFVLIPASQVCCPLRKWRELKEKQEEKRRGGLVGDGSKRYPFQRHNTNVDVVLLFSVPPLPILSNTTLSLDTTGL